MRLGPAVLVTAAFVGPGTVTTCVLAGAGFGYALLWALVFATLATILLQEMAARLGAGARLGLGEALMGASGRRELRLLIGGLLIVALVIGNAAYEGGNLAGGALGLSALTGEAVGGRVGAILLAALAGAALVTGRYRLLERLLIGLVLVMSVAFCAAVVLVAPDPGALLAGFVPRVPDGGGLMAVALIGTTIVPYNLFLHAAAARERFEGEGAVRAARRDTILAVGLGGIISCAILVTAGTTLGGEGAQGALDVARALEPALGPWGRVLIGLGLLAAGLTSAITAPMATGFVLSEIIGGDEARRARIFRAAALGVLLVGVFLTALGIRPVSLIVMAQAANGLLLPGVALYLLVVMNRRAVLGRFANGGWSNLAGAAVVLVTFGLGARTLARVIGVWP